MQSKLLTKHSRRIAGLLPFLAALPGLAFAAESPGIRLSSPTIGWVLASDGLQLIEIAGIAASPRAGRAVALPSAARRFWTSPDANAVILRLDNGIFLLGSGEQLAELSEDFEVTAVWDRSSTGFAICWAEKCEARAANGAIRHQWKVSSGSRVIAYSAEAGLVTASAEDADWHYGGELIHLDAVPAAAAFRSGTKELWLLNPDGRISGQDRQGRRLGEGELVAGALGLVGSLDGKAFFAVNAEGEAAVYSLESAQTVRVAIGNSVEGVWPAPGLFAVRLHESAKRPIAIWNGETGITGWMPAATSEVRQ